ncbi:MAG TPA: HDOD domain-containing protein [Candidatus Acidoferrum sp.]|nr:HDOD domain-containing protein [Candidatus Acidoferrum sp.]
MYERFIARQPILNDKLKLAGYELLFRARDDNRAGANPAATSQLILSSTMLFDWNTLVDGASAHINFGAEEILNGAALLLPKEQTVIEIPPTLEFNEELIAAIKNLRLSGYRAALDGYAGQEIPETVLRYMNFVKVDFREVGAADQEAIKEALAKFDAKLVAKKVETWKEYETAKQLGYSHFQGYFFLEPQILKRREVPGTKAHCLELLRLVHQKQMNVPQIEELLKQEPSLLYKLLRFLNSPLKARQAEVRTVRSAISLLGDDEFRRWASLVAVMTPAADKPNELIRTGLTRAFFCEALARVKPNGATPFEYFMVGLFSVMNALLDRPLADIMAELPVNGKVRAALGGKTNELRHALNAAVAFELGKWEDFSVAMLGLELDEQRAPECQSEANRCLRELQI